MMRSMTYDLRGKTLGAGKDSIGGAGGYLTATFGLGYGAWKILSGISFISP